VQGWCLRVLADRERDPSATTLVQHSGIPAALGDKGLPLCWTKGVPLCWTGMPLCWPPAALFASQLQHTVTLTLLLHARPLDAGTLAVARSAGDEAAGPMGPQDGVCADGDGSCARQVAAHAMWACAPRCVACTRGDPVLYPRARVRRIRHAAEA
jgi:hypothetical protein